MPFEGLPLRLLLKCSVSTAALILLEPVTPFAPRLRFLKNWRRSDGFRTLAAMSLYFYHHPRYRPHARCAAGGVRSVLGLPRGGGDARVSLGDHIRASAHQHLVSCFDELLMIMAYPMLRFVQPHAWPGHRHQRLDSPGDWSRARAFAPSLALIVLCSVGSPLPMQGQAAPRRFEQIRGRVLRADGTPIVDATVVATAVPSTESQSAASDSLGRVVLRFAVGTGNYVLRISAPGFQVGRQRVLRPEATVDDSTLRFTTVLAGATVQTLSGVVVAASRRQRPSVRDDGSDVGGASDEGIRPLDPLARGDLNLLATSVAGVLPVGAPGESGFSVLGLSPADNTVRLNGLTSGATQLPASARVSTRLQTTTYDPAVGGFSGGALTVLASPGSNFVSGGLDASLDVPALQATDRVGAALGQPFQQARLSGYRSGALVRDKIFFNGSVEASRRANSMVTIGTASPLALQGVGVSTVTAGRFRTLLDSLQIPDATTAAGGVVAYRGLGLLRVDFFPSSTRALNVVMTADQQMVDPVQVTALGTSSIGGRARASSAGAQLEFARFVDEFYLTRVRSGLSMHVTSATPVFDFPRGQVLTAGNGSATDASFATLSFGGSSRFPRSERAWSWQTTAEAAWFSPSNRHRPKLTSGVVVEGARSDDVENTLGTFTFNSLDQFAARQPASYTRTLSGTAQTSREVSAWLSAGDVWRPTRHLTLQYGVRAEGNEYVDNPMYNPQVDSAFGLRTSTLPRNVALLPRVGFAWSYGSESRISLFGASPKGTLHGGIGAFRSVLGVSLPGDALANSGLPQGAQQITCIGPAAPTPDWSAYAQSSLAIPRACAGGVAGFTETRPSVVVFARDYQPSEAWRGNLGWSGSVAGLHATADAVYSLNLFQAGTTDQNLVSHPKFTLSREGGRPVFVVPSAIDPSSGGIGLSSSRASDAAGRITELTSDGRSRSAQLALTLSPISGLFVTRFWTLGYALTHVQDRVVGFDGSTFDDPRAQTGWETAPTDVRKTLTGTLAWQFGDATWLRLTAQMRSGAPYTPLVLGDINGDGLPNDRAFVFDPAQVADTSMAHGLSQLLQGSASARACLMTQLNAPARRNSCRGPWTSTSSAQLAFDGPTVGLTRRATFLITAANPLSGFDALVHGVNGIHGWGQPALPDPILYAVQGFDPATGAFRYSVNPNFGSTHVSSSSLRVPFRLSFSASITLGGAYPEQLTEELLSVGRTRSGERLTAAQLAGRYGQSGILDPIEPILLAQDSLLLTEGQLVAMKALKTRYHTQADSLWGALGREFAALGQNYDRARALERLHIARSGAYVLVANAATEIRGLLTNDQLALLGPDLLQLLDDRAIERLRRADARSY